MIPNSTNLFCEPSPLLTPLIPSGGTLQWSADGVTYQDGPAPADTDIYLRVTADFDFAGAESALFELISPASGDSLNGTAGAGTFTSDLIPGGLPAQTYAVTITPALGYPVVFDAGQLIFA